KDSLVSDGGTLGDRLPIVTVAHGNAKLFDTLPQPDVFLEYHKRNGPPFTQIDVDPTRGPAIICSPVRFFVIVCNVRRRVCFGTSTIIVGRGTCMQSVIGFEGTVDQRPPFF